MKGDKIGMDYGVMLSYTRTITLMSTFEEELVCAREGDFNQERVF